MPRYNSKLRRWVDDEGRIIPVGKGYATNRDDQTITQYNTDGSISRTPWREWGISYWLWALEHIPSMKSRLKYMMLSTNERWHLRCAYEYFMDNCNASYKEIHEDSLDMTAIRAYVRHVPVRGISEGWPDWFYEMTDKWLYKVYEYSKQKGYIKDNDGYEVFLHMITRLSNVDC